ncbi:uncharacterized protein LOC135199419 [Macrobrachium nipponense]|uniref:uncharacterized protein LOC135199419 n=1 Tax=Macrobrachium nipponense TaxID=159736 RepID=UPI0030C7FB7B
MAGLANCPRGCKTAFVLRVFAVCNKEKNRMRHMININRPYDRVANFMGITSLSVRKIVHRNRSVISHESAGKVFPIPQVFDNFTVGAIHRFVHEIFAAKQVFTVRTLMTDLKTATIIPETTSEIAVWRLLQDMGFRYKTSQRKMYLAKEPIDVVCRRIGALRALKRHREDGREIVYVDETWFTNRMSHNREWVDTAQPATSATHSRQVPPGEGERFVVVAAGTANGFIEGPFLCYPAKSTSGDYHGEMTGELFIPWLTTQLLPLLPEPSVLVLDNVPYHSQLLDECRCPTTATKKADLITWLQSRRIPAPDGATRPELLLICQKNRPKPQYIVDNIIREWGHEVVRLSPAHPELNAIEQVWACMKRHVVGPIIINLDNDGEDIEDLYLDDDDDENE